MIKNVNGDHNYNCTDENRVNVYESSIVANNVLMDQEITDSSTSWLVALKINEKRHNECTLKN